MSKIELDSYFIGDTYAGVLEGLPTPEEIFKSTSKHADRIFGERKKYIHNPYIPSNKHLPKRCNMAMLTENNNGDDPDGWELVVIWFSDTDPKTPLKDALAVVDSYDGWDKLKSPWYY